MRDSGLCQDVQSRASHLKCAPCHFLSSENVAEVCDSVKIQRVRDEEEV